MNRYSKTPEPEVRNKKIPDKYSDIRIQEGIKILKKYHDQNDENVLGDFKKTRVLIYPNPKLKMKLT